MPEEGKVEVTLIQGTRIAGEQLEAGDEVEVYEAEKRHLVAAGYVAGDGSSAREDAASEAEVAQGNLEPSKKASGKRS